MVSGLVELDEVKRRADMHFRLGEEVLHLGGIQTAIRRILPDRARRFHDRRKSFQKGKERIGS